MEECTGNMVCAGIVLYNPDIGRLTENVGAVLPQVGGLIVVDNGSTEIGRVRKVIDEKYPERVTWLINGENRGIAFALNQIVDEAECRGFSWALTLDQDSVCGEGLAAKLLAAAMTDASIAMASPYIVDLNLTSMEEYRGMELLELEEIPMCITSGCLTRVAAVKAAGGFNNTLFIDRVDHEMCVRLRLAGYKVIRANRAWILHEEGKIHLDTLSVGHTKPLRHSNHPPVRVYYQTRNLLHLLRTYPGCMGMSNSRYWTSYCLGIGVKLLFEPQKTKKFVAFLRGIRDYRKLGAVLSEGEEGRHGKL